MGSDLIVKSTGFIKTSAALTGKMFSGMDVIGGTAKATVTIYDSGANTGTVLAMSKANIAETEHVELSSPVVGTGLLWVEIAGTQANAVVRYL